VLLLSASLWAVFFSHLPSIAFTWVALLLCIWEFSEWNLSPRFSHIYSLFWFCSVFAGKFQVSTSY